MTDDRLELNEVFPAPPSRDEELCRIANLPLEPSDDDDGLELLELDLDAECEACRHWGSGACVALGGDSTNPKCPNRP